MKDLAESRKVNAISAFERVRTFLSFVFTEADRLIMTHTSEILTLHHNCLKSIRITVNGLNTGVTCNSVV